jgi:hypothetical protein
MAVMQGISAVANVIGNSDMAVEWGAWGMDGAVVAIGNSVGHYDMVLSGCASIVCSNMVWLG